MTNQIIKVLLVEDNPTDAMLLCEELSEAEDAAFSIMPVERVAPALDHIANHPVDVVLLDLSLPDGYGVPLVEKFCATAPLLPIVVLTRQNDRQLAMQTLEIGAQDYLIKGQADRDTLVRAIRYAIQRAYALQELQQAREELEVRVQQRTAELAQTNEELRAEIVERKRVELSLQQAKAAVEAASRTKSEFYSRMSHELRTPLNAILGFGQLLKMDDLTARQQQSVEHILTAGQHLLHLVDQVLEIAASGGSDALLFPDVAAKPPQQADEAQRNAVEPAH